MSGMTVCWRRWDWKLALASWLAIGGAYASSGDCAVAQITPDGTLPNNSRVTTQDNIRTIEGGTQAGSNLFHSFGEFSVPTGGTAFFNNAADIQNIISRVTGKSISNIDGLIRANGTANLFLINPNGIIFGSNASLNIGGSFVASTASSLKFADGTQFSATAPQTTPLLTISVPIGLQYGGNAGSILNQSQATNSSGLVTGLQVRSGNTLALVGGDVKLDGGNLQAPGGRVELGGLSGAGTVGIDTGVAPLRFPDNVARADVSLTNGAEVNVRAGGGGSIAINAQNLNLAEESKLRAGIASGLGSVDSKAGNIEINATGAIKLTDGSFMANVVQKGAVGNGGDINIQAESISSTDGSKIIATTFGRGDAGNVTINARDTVSFDEEKRQDSYYPSPYGGVYSRVEKEAVGHGGNINVTTGSLSITNGAVLTTSIYGQGDAGNVYINARDTVSLNGKGRISKESSGAYSAVNSGAIGQGGNLNVTANSLEMNNGGVLNTTIRGQGNAGNVIVRVKDAVDLAGASILSTVDAGGVGKGGNIDINAATLSLTDIASLQTRTGSASNTQPAGRGDAGNVNVNVTGAINIAGSRDSSRSGIFSRVETGTVGNAGNITIDSGSFSLRDGAQLTASTRGQGNGGNVTVRALDSVSLANGDILSTVDAGGVGKGGNIDINAATLSLTDGAQLLTDTSDASKTQPAGRGDAGNVNLNVTGAIDIAGKIGTSPSGIFSRVQTGTVGNAGNITIDSGSFSLRDGAQLTASTRGQGNAGNVTVRARNAVDLAGSQTNISSTVSSGGVGKGGNIDIKAATLSLTDGANVLTLTRRESDTQPAGRGDAGNVNLNVTGAIDIAGSRGTSSGIFSRVETGTVGNGGNITIDSGSFSLRDGAELSASTRAQGNAGNVTVRARDAVSLANAKILSTVGPGGVGKGGNIDINAATLSLTDGAQLQTLTNDAYDTQPAGRGDAGNVNVNVTGAIDIAGSRPRSPSGIFSRVETETVGNAGNITIDSGSFSLRDGAQLTALTSGQGNAGTIKLNAAAKVTISSKSSNRNSSLFVNSESPTGTTGDIIVTSPRVTIDNGGTLNARSASGKGGDINLQTDLLLLRRGAQISTTAGTNGAGGNGGNITINTPNGFIVAGARENNDITANAFSGSGGRVTINATSIFGMTVRTREDLVRLLGTNLDPQRLPTNDITAISQTSPTLNGTVTVNTPDVDPNSGLVNLPAVPVDTQVAQGCTAGGAQAQSSFIITGRGGLPPNPGEALSTDAVQVDLITLNSEVAQRSTTAVSTTPTSPTPPPIVEATGWVIDGNGDIILTANAPTVTPHNSWQRTADCRAFNQQSGG